MNLAVSQGQLAASQEPIDEAAMNWKIKAAIQNGIAVLPSSLSYRTYYEFQRKFGGLKTIDYLATTRMSAAVGMWDFLEEAEQRPYAKRFFEVGTGRVPIVPISMWLMGAKTVTTVDLNPYVQDEMVSMLMDFIVKDPEQVRTIFGKNLDESRFDSLLALAKKEPQKEKLFQLCDINYLAPADAANSDLEAQSVDVHMSYTVLEHIPEDALGSILRESSRLVAADGICLHHVDYSDHFSHSDKEISSINFLQYPNSKWRWFGDNRYMYMNRLRHDDMTTIFESAGHELLNVRTTSDARVVDVLSSPNFIVDSRFADKPSETLAVTSASFITRPPSWQPS